MPALALTSYTAEQPNKWKTDLSRRNSPVAREKWQLKFLTNSDMLTPYSHFYKTLSHNKFLDLGFISGGGEGR